MPALPCWLFTQLSENTPVWIIILWQALIHYTIAKWIRNRTPIRYQIYSHSIGLAVIVPIIAYISNIETGRSFVQSGIIYVLMQMALNSVIAWRVICRLK